MARRSSAGIAARSPQECACDYNTGRPRFGAPQPLRTRQLQVDRVGDTRNQHVHSRFRNNHALTHTSGGTKGSGGCCRQEGARWSEKSNDLDSVGLAAAPWGSAKSCRKARRLERLLRNPEHLSKRKDSFKAATHDMFDGQRLGFVDPPRALIIATSPHSYPQQRVIRCDTSQMRYRNTGH